MKTAIFIFILNSIFYIKITEAQLPQSGPSNLAGIPSQTLKPKADPQKPALATITPQYFENNTPKCYPQTAKAYFLPAPPSQPKVTVLDPNFIDPSTSKKTHNSQAENNKDSVTNSQTVSNMAGNRAAVIPPPLTQEPMLPDLKDEVPTVVQERVSRLAESDGKVCNACAKLQKSPIFKFDEELLQGFLAGLGL